VAVEIRSAQGQPLQLLSTRVATLGDLVLLLCGDRWMIRL